MWLGRLYLFRGSRPPEFLSRMQRAGLGSQEAVPQALTLTGDARFIDWRQRRLFYFFLNADEDILRMPSVSWLRPYARTHLKKFHICVLGGALDKYQRA